MPRARNGQEFSEAFDDAEHQRLEQKHDVHVAAYST
jgi:hypothetical protein